MTYTKDETLRELRNHHAQLMSFADALDGKLSSLFQNSAVVITLFGAYGSLSKMPLWYWIGLGLVALLYLVCTVLALSAWKPASYRFPLPASWDPLALKYFVLDENDMRDALVKQYTEVIQHTKTVLDSKARTVTVGTWLLAVAVFVLVVLQIVVRAVALP